MTIASDNLFTSNRLTRPRLGIINIDNPSDIQSPVFRDYYPFKSPWPSIAGRGDRQNAMQVQEMSSFYGIFIYFPTIVGKLTPKSMESDGYTIAVRLAVDELWLPCCSHSEKGQQTLGNVKYFTNLPSFISWCLHFGFHCNNSILDELLSSEFISILIIWHF